VLAAGHTVGGHTWSRADLENVLAADGADAAIEQIEKGAGAVHFWPGCQPRSGSGKDLLG
jgi:hypothetical protein